MRAGLTIRQKVTGSPPLVPHRDLPVHLPILSAPPALLPASATRWLSHALATPLAAEVHATCHACSLAPPEGARYTHGGPYFHPVHKCCTFVPTLPNYAVGEALAAGGEGARRVEARIALGGGVSPLALDRTGLEALIAREGRAGFGQAAALRCPYLTEAGSCSVWLSRNAVCSTWFCRHTQGARGERLWRSVKMYLSVAERAVAMHCALTLDLDGDALAAHLHAATRAETLDAHDLDGTLDPARARAIWGRWYGRERDFFRACAEVASRVDGPQLQALGGVTLAAHAKALRATLTSANATTLPARTRLGVVRIHGLRDGVATVEGYSVYDLLDVPAAVLDVLPYFDDALVTEARARCLAERGIEVDDSFILRLLDYCVLIADDASDARAASASRS